MPYKRPHKYRAVRTEVDGIAFHSKAEARRYGELKLLEKAGEIRYLRLQPEFPLYSSIDLAIHEDSDPLKLGVYRGDFAYERLIGRRSDGENVWGPQIVEDVKGIDTPLSKWKRKHVKAQYGIDVQIVR